MSFRRTVSLIFNVIGHQDNLQKFFNAVGSTVCKYALPNGTETATNLKRQETKYTYYVKKFMTRIYKIKY